MKNDIAKVMISKEEIAQKVLELGEQIAKDYHDKNPVMICILKGAVVFYTDLIRAIPFHVEMDFMAISSYGNSRQSSGVVKILKDLDGNIEGRDVIIVEDIMDSGQTLSHLTELLSARNPNSLKVCSLLDKPSRRISDIQPDYCGFVIPDEFVVGYGLDYAERYRNLDFIGILRPEVYQGEEE